MKNIVVFGGTTEGRQLVYELERLKRKAWVCVATDYGIKVLLDSLKMVTGKVGRMTQEEMELFIRTNQIQLVIDATHPYAVLVSENIKKACETCKTELIRVVREEDELVDGAIYFDSVKEVAEYLNDKSGNVFVTTGSKELAAYTKVKDYRSRLFIRILPAAASVAIAKQNGYDIKNCILCQGPFSKEDNIKMLKECNAAFLVSKDTGTAGGFFEKVEAAKECQVVLLLIRRPKAENGMTLSEALDYLRKEQTT